MNSEESPAATVIEGRAKKDEQQLAEYSAAQPVPPDRRDFNAEARVQAKIVEWVRQAAPQVVIFAVLNGELRTPAQAARARWTGTTAGIPNLAIVAPGGRIFFAEVKSASGSLSAAQREIHERLAALGCSPAILRSVDDARRALAAWAIETREVHRG